MSCGSWEISMGMPSFFVECSLNFTNLFFSVCDFFPKATGGTSAVLEKVAKFGVMGLLKFPLGQI